MRAVFRRKTVRFLSLSGQENYRLCRYVQSIFRFKSQVETSDPILEFGSPTELCIEQEVTMTAAGTPEDIKKNPESLTGRFL